MLFRDEYSFLSNMYLLDHPITFKGIKYYSTENFYMAMKTRDVELRKQISEMTPGKSKRFCRDIELRSDWDDVKIKVMRAALKAKFKQPRMKALLLAVEGDIVEDNYWKDYFWGVCDGIGDNHLGKLLMEIRDE